MNNRKKNFNTSTVMSLLHTTCWDFAFLFLLLVCLYLFLTRFFFFNTTIKTKDFSSSSDFSTILFFPSYPSTKIFLQLGHCKSKFKFWPLFNSKTKLQTQMENEEEEKKGRKCLRKSNYLSHFSTPFGVLVSHSHECSHFQWILCISRKQHSVKYIHTKWRLS